MGHEIIGRWAQDLKSINPKKKKKNRSGWIWKNELETGQSRTYLGLDLDLDFSIIYGLKNELGHKTDLNEEIYSVHFDKFSLVS